MICSVLDILATKYDNRETVISIICNQFSKCTNTCPQPWPPLINGLVNDTYTVCCRYQLQPGFFSQIAMIISKSGVENEIVNRVRSTGRLRQRTDPEIRDSATLPLHPLTPLQISAYTPLIPKYEHPLNTLLR